MNRTLILVLLVFAGGLSHALENFTLPPVNVDLVYTPFSITGSAASVTITLPYGSNAWIETLPSYGTLYPYGGGGPIAASSQVSDSQGRVTFVLYSDIDTVTSFIYAESAPSTTGRRYGLCSIRLDSNNISGAPGVLDVLLTDLATGAKLTGASVAMTSPSTALVEVGQGQYRAQTTTTQSRTFDATLSGYNPLNFTTTLTAGIFGTTTRTMVNPTPGTVNISTTASNPTGANPIPIRIFFFKPVNAALGDFTIGGILVSNGTVTSLDGGQIGRAHV